MIKLTINTEDDLKLKLFIEDSNSSLNDEGEIVRRELTEYEIDIKIELKNQNSKLVEWEIKKVNQEYYNVDEDDQDSFDKILENVVLKYEINFNGRIANIKTPIKTFRKIRLNTKKVIDSEESIGMQPQQEVEYEKVYQDAMEWLYMEELFKLVKKFHHKYGIEVPKQELKIERGTFKRKIAKTEIPSTNKIESNFFESKNYYEYQLTKEIDYEKTLGIFKKDAIEFKPFVKEKLLEFVKKGKYYCKFEENIKYDLITGLIILNEEKSYTKLGGNMNLDILKFEIK